jgi:malate dehydrogenase (oxaloacetate-decarboxylating)
MEGKALLFKHLGGVGAFPVVVDTQDPDEIIQAVKWIAPGFGGVNLEDIASPKCFYILDRLREELEIPVWHDDQQGTAAVTLAALLNGLKVVGKTLEDSTVALFGMGAAGAATLRILVKGGLPAGQIRVVDLVDGRPTLLDRRMDLEQIFPYRGEMLSQTNAERLEGGYAEALAGADALVSFTQPGPKTLDPRWLSAMRKDSIALLMANPVPEVWPWEAKEAGVRVVGTGRSDFPNQVNNSIGFPGIFRGTLDVRARTITDEMTIAAAHAIAKTAERSGLSEDYIVPTMMETDVFINVAVAVGLEAVRQGIARRVLTEEELRREAETTIRRAQEETKILMRAGHIPPPPDAKRA